MMPPRPNPVRLLDWLLPELERKCANLQPDPGEGRTQEQAFAPFTSRIHHRRWNPGSFRVEAQLN